MCKHHVKLMPWLGIALCAFILALLPIVVSFRYVNGRAIGVIGECVAFLWGMLLFTPLAFCEDHEGRREVLACRPEPYWRGFAVRLSFSMLLAALFIAVLLLIARSQALPFQEYHMGTGLYTNALLFGCLGLSLGQLLRNQPISYLISFACFGFELFTRGRFTGRFFLLSMMEGELYSEKLVLLGIAVITLVVNIPLSMRQVSVGASLRETG